MTIGLQPSVVAIVVTYYPDLDLLASQVKQLAPQVRNIIIVDNGSSCDLVAWNLKQGSAASVVIAFGENLGIAAAQNAGIEWARRNGADFVLLMDQDSVPAPDMVEKLTAAFGRLTSAAAVGPQYLDVEQNKSPFVQLRKLTVKRRACDNDNSIVPVDCLISSGTLIPVPVLDKVGGMRDDFFIDYVDTEWVLRARHHGLQSYGVCCARMRHKLGDYWISLFGKKICCRSPLRHYYQQRNAVLLIREPWIPLQWRLMDMWRILLRYVLYSLFAKPRSTHFWMMTLGLWHGMVGKSGKLSKGNL